MTTRKEQIEKAAKEIAFMYSFREKCFIAGAEWADANPYDGPLSKHNLLVGNAHLREQVAKLEKDLHLAIVTIETANNESSWPLVKGLLRAALKELNK